MPFAAGRIEGGAGVQSAAVVEAPHLPGAQFLLQAEARVAGEREEGAPGAVERVHALGGRVEGTVVADERVEIQGTALVTGDVHTKSIVVLEGGKINGNVRMGDGVAASFGNSVSQRKPALAAS